MNFFSLHFFFWKELQILSPAVGFATTPFSEAMHDSKSCITSLHFDSSPFHCTQLWTASESGLHFLFGRILVPSKLWVTLFFFLHFWRQASNVFARWSHFRPLLLFSRRHSRYLLVSVLHEAWFFISKGFAVHLRRAVQSEESDAAGNGTTTTAIQSVRNESTVQNWPQNKREIKTPCAQKNAAHTVL